MMKQHKTFRVACWVIISLATILPGWGQQSDAPSPRRSAVCSGVPHPELEIAGRYRLARTIQDRGTRQRWLLLEDLSRPAAPALLLEERNPDCAGRWTQSVASRSQMAALSIPVIRAGDSIILSEHTRVADAELEATALRAAATGETLTVRMKFGGLTLKAVAVSAGHAKVVEETSGASQ